MNFFFFFFIFSFNELDLLTEVLFDLGFTMRIFKVERLPVLTLTLTLTTPSAGTVRDSEITQRFQDHVNHET